MKRHVFWIMLMTASLVSADPLRGTATCNAIGCSVSFTAGPEFSFAASGPSEGFSDPFSPNEPAVIRLTDFGIGTNGGDFLVSNFGVTSYCDYTAVLGGAECGGDVTIDTGTIAVPDNKGHSPGDVVTVNAPITGYADYTSPELSNYISFSFNGVGTYELTLTDPDTFYLTSVQATFGPPVPEPATGASQLSAWQLWRPVSDGVDLGGRRIGRFSNQIPAHEPG